MAAPPAASQSHATPPTPRLALCPSLLSAAAYCAGEFVDANETLLRSMPPPLVAAQYYLGADLYQFDEFQTSWARGGAPTRTPPCETLYDVFSNVRDDEGEHVKTMAACQDGSVMLDLEARREGGRRV